MRVTRVFLHAQAMSLHLVLLSHVGAASEATQRCGLGARLGRLGHRVNRAKFEAEQAISDMSLAQDELEQIRVRVEQHRSRMQEKGANRMFQRMIRNTVVLMWEEKLLMEKRISEMNTLADTLGQVKTRIDALRRQVNSMDESSASELEREVRSIADSVNEAIMHQRNKMVVMNSAMDLLKTIKWGEAQMSNAT